MTQLENLDFEVFKLAYKEYVSNSSALEKDRQEKLGERENIHENLMEKLDEVNLEELSKQEFNEDIYRKVFEIFDMVAQKSYQAGKQHYLSFFGAQRYHQFKNGEDAEADVKEMYPGEDIDENIVKLRNLLYSKEEELKQAYEEYCSIDYIAGNNATAFLMYKYPEDFVMVNGKTENALQRIGIDIPSSWQDYESYQSILNKIESLFEEAKSFSIDSGFEHFQNFLDVDWFFHNLGVGNIPAGDEGLPDFRFTKKDFERRTGESDDAGYLKERFEDFRKKFVENLGGTLYEYYKMSKAGRGEWPRNGKGNPYVPRKNTRSGGDTSPRENFWMGFARCDVEDGDDPRHFAQFQIYQHSEGDDDDLFVGIWIRGGGSYRVPEDRRDYYASQVRNNLEDFLEKLPGNPNYEIQASGYLRKNLGDVTEEDMDDICDALEDDSTTFKIGEFLDADEVVDKGNEIVPLSIEVVKDFTPTYALMIDADNPLNGGESEGEKLEEANPKLLGELKEAENNLRRKGQMILYGPPGTSKTFFAKQLAIWMLSREAVVGEERVNKKFKELKEGKFSDLVQFHPSYSYEDFIEGYRPNPDDENSDDEGDSPFSLEDGIFKEMCENASETEDEGEFYSSLVGSYAEFSPPIDLPSEVKSSLSKYNKQNAIVRLTQSEFQKIISLDGASLPDDFPDSEEVEGYYLLDFNPDSDWQDTLEEEYRYGPGTGAYKRLSSDCEEGTAGFIYRGTEGKGMVGAGYFDDIKQEEGPKERILIIDEINRGDLSKIFGELIYSLEYRDSSVKLQYSKEPLEIPKNLFLIGTMNTADRSIALVDAAIRRRFSFLSKMPDYGFIANYLGLTDDSERDNVEELVEELEERYHEAENEEKYKLLSFLAVKEINGEITSKEQLGREKQIGHTYLTRLKEDAKSDFVYVWKHEILPLLEEYYYFDYSSLENLLEDEEGKLMDKELGIKDFEKDELVTVLEKVCDLSR